ncbi:MAG: Chain length determinant protein, partial [Solirubrobacteraceae bacterium]|nr:Chain length determinant protein [Solirubrobacteraceae bacterium]
MNNGSLAAFAWRWWWVLLIATLLAAGAGYGAATRITKTYEAETQLLVGQLNTTVDLDASGTLARTYAQIGKGRPVLARAIRAV